MNRIAGATDRQTAGAPPTKVNRRWYPGRHLLGVGLLTIAVLSSSAAGEIDPTFGGDGWVFTLASPGNRTGAMAVQPDGKVIVVGTSGSYVATWRYLSSGRLDEAFGHDGVRTVQVGYRSAQVHDLALQPDGKMVVGGQVGKEAMVVRLMPDGSLDMSFGGGDGIVTIDHPERSSLAAVQVLLFPDGGILAEVNRSTRFRSRSFLTRLSLAGSTDPAFGRAGRIPVGKWVPPIALGSAGILIARHDPSSTHRVVVFRYGLDGTLDTGFGAGGSVSFSLGSDAYDAHATAIATDDLGRITLAGAGGTALCFFDSTVVVRLTPDGRLDPDFAHSSGCFDAVSIMPSADGSVVLVGSVFAGGGSGEYHLWLSRLRTDGLPDASFGDEGRVVAAPEDGYWLWARGADVQPDGKIVVFARASYEPTFLLARFDGA